MQVFADTAPVLRRLLRIGLSRGVGLKDRFQVRGLSVSRERRMRLVQFHTAKDQDGVRVGVEEKDGGDVIDLNQFDSSLPRTMREFLERGEAALATARRAVSCKAATLSRSEVTFLSPMTNPDKVVCVGRNYLDHCQEQNAPLPTEPVIFNKFPSSIVGPYSDIIHPAESNEVDWEVELAFVIGKKGKHIKREEAMDHVVGYMVAHDVSARDWQLKRNGKQWLLGKTFDTFCPLGPALVTRDAISDPHNLGIRCRVNGKVMQDSNTNQLIFNTEALVTWISQERREISVNVTGQMYIVTTLPLLWFVTLFPGDVVLTGTPSGVGVFRKPPVFLQRGDTVECEIDEIGTLRNTVV